MRKLISVTMMGVMAMGLCFGISGCSDETSAKKEETVKTPTGTATTTTETKVKTSGENPPAPKAP